MANALAGAAGSYAITTDEIMNDSLSHHMSDSLQTGIGLFYFLAALMNVGFALHYQKVAKDMLQAIIWYVVAGLFGVLAALYLAHHGIVIFPWLQNLVDWIMGPVTYFLIAVVTFSLALYFRSIVTHPAFAWSVLMVTLWFSGLAMTNDNFKSIITKPDNVPIVMLIFSVGFLTWLALRKAVINDERIARGEPPLEKMGEEKVLVWPDLVYTELIAMVICTLILIVWAIVLKAPLEQPASSARIPNPSKAPWYFLGLQEMLVYYDPWMAGVVLPTMIIQGLIALPFIDFNQKGNGYYTFVERKFAMTTFLFGFIVLWCVLIVLGTFLRGPNWNFFGPFEPWDPHKNVPLNNINLSEYFWLGLGMSATSGHWFIRELPGILFVFAYLFILPPLLAKTILRTFFIRMGFMRFMLLVTLIQFMACLPIKMVLRWSFNLKYIVFIPEYFFNI
jgi:Cytochrome b(C-terminal)/b6/petD